MSHWSSKLDRPNKRIHTASLDAGTENKRIKCDESSRRGSPLSLEDHLLGKQHQQSLRKPANINGSPLLRRLVSQQTVQRSNSSYNGESYTSSPRRGENAGRTQRDLEIDEAEGDSGGGGYEDGGGSRARVPPERTSSGCSSVLMNLLVSGCDVSAGYVCFAKPKPSKSIAST